MSIFNFWRRKKKPIFRTMLEMASTAPIGQASEEAVSIMKSCLASSPNEQKCFDVLNEISKRSDVSSFVVTLCDVQEYYERPE